MKKRGFTLVELMVVIAIIGILTATILTALSAAKNKSKDSRIKTDLGQLSVIATIFGDDNGTFVGWCLSDENNKLFNDIDKQFDQALPDAYTSGIPACHSDANGWAIAAKTARGGSICTDSTGDTRIGTTITFTSLLPTPTTARVSSTTPFLCINGTVQ